MENYNFKQMGVDTISLAETREIKGGLIGSLAACIAISGAIIYLYNNYGDFVQGVKDGFNGVYKYE